MNVNTPDLVLFVGEALVGNDGVDQLVKFNQALTDLSTSNKPRLIDGIILTKFDTIDDKVLWLSFSYLQHTTILMLLVCIGWGSLINGLHNRTAHCICGNWATLHQP